MNKDELRTTSGFIGVAAAFGSAVQQNMRRSIYKVRITNEFAGPNLITLSKQENGAILPAIDFFHPAVQYEQIDDPEDLHEDSAPLYIIEGAGTGGASNLRAASAGGANTAYLTIWYSDAPAPT